VVLLHADQLMRKPCDRVRFAAACGVLDQIAPSDPMYADIGQESAHHFKLVIAWEYLNVFLLAGLLVLFFNDLGIVFQDIREPILGEDALPEIVGLETMRVGRITRAIVAALVEGQKPRTLTLKTGAEANLLFIHGKVGHASAELEQTFA